VARILVVDDEPDVRELFNITLKMAGHNTETAKDGVEAVDKLEGEIPDLVLLDLMMPRMDGFGLLKHIRSEMDSIPMRVLIATAKVLEDQDKERLSTWPVVGVLNKGELDIGAMVGIVSTALERDPKPAQTPEAKADGKPKEVEPSSDGKPKEAEPSSASKPKEVQSASDSKPKVPEPAPDGKSSTAPSTNH
jgi:CheY-like chemotaxis protein